MDDIGGKRGESRCNRLLKIEKATVYRLKRNRPNKKVCKLKRNGCSIYN